MTGMRIKCQQCGRFFSSEVYPIHVEMVHGEEHIHPHPHVGVE